MIGRARGEKAWSARACLCVCGGGRIQQCETPGTHLELVHRAVRIWIFIGRRHVLRQNMKMCQERGGDMTSRSFSAIFHRVYKCDNRQHVGRLYAP